MTQPPNNLVAIGMLKLSGGILPSSPIFTIQNLRNPTFAEKRIKTSRNLATFGHVSNFAKFLVI